MTTGMIGADPQVLRDLAVKFDDAADQLDGVKGSVQVWVDRGDIWRGLDNQRFITNWNSGGSKAVANVAAQLRRFSKILRVNADEQDRTSTDYNNSSGSGLFCSEDQATAPTLGAAAKSASELFKKLHNQDPNSVDGVRIEKVRGDDNVERFIVYINGTNQGAEGTHTLADAILGQSAVLNKTYQLVRQAMIEAGIDSSSQVMYVGYSQGGIVGQNLAASGDFGHGLVLAQASPRTSNIPAGYDIIHINRSADEVTNLIAPLSFVNDHSAGISGKQKGFDYVHTYQDPWYQKQFHVGQEFGRGNGFDFWGVHKDMDGQAAAVRDFENADNPDAKKSHQRVAQFLGGDVIEDWD